MKFNRILVMESVVGSPGAKEVSLMIDHLGACPK
jgi:hypothetical protein